MTPAERKRWGRIRKAMGRPKIGAGAKVISLSVEKGLLERADAYAGRKGLKRAQLVALGLEMALARSGKRVRPALSRPSGSRRFVAESAGSADVLHVC